MAMGGYTKSPQRPTSAFCRGPEERPSCSPILWFSPYVGRGPDCTEAARRRRWRCLGESTRHRARRQVACLSKGHEGTLDGAPRLWSCRALFLRARARVGRVALWGALRRKTTDAMDDPTSRQPAGSAVRWRQPVAGAHQLCLLAPANIKV
jgi:hypothetical protein